MALSGCPTQPVQPQGTVAVAPDTDYVHAASYMTFPPAVGEFRRVDVRQYDDSGLDVSVGYNAGGAADGIAATVYVYPAPPIVSVGSPTSVIAAARSTSTEQEFKTRQREIMGAHPDAKMLSEGDATLRQGSESYVRRKAAFAFEQGFARKQQRVGSELYVFGFVGGEWIVKYRFTYPIDLDAANRIATFMRDLTLTIPPES
jgi:hypothetical protein